jgi:hypothetical protein
VGLRWNAEPAPENRGEARSWTSEWRWEKQQRLRVEDGGGWGVSGGSQPTSQSRAVVDCWASLLRLRVVLKTELPHLSGKGADSQSCSCRTMQLPPGENNRSDHFALTGSELPQVSITACPVDISQSPGETTSGFPLAMDGPWDQEKQKTKPKPKPKTLQ